MKCFQRKRGCSSAQLSFNSAVSKKKNGSKLSKQSKAKMKPFPHIKLPSHFLIFRWGARALWATGRWRGSCCILKSPVSTSSSLILHRSLWHPEQARSDLAACCISILVGQAPPRTLFTKVSTRLAIRASHRLFDAELADWAEPALLNVTLIVLNCLNFTLLSLFKHYPCVSHEAHLYAFTLVGSEEYCVFCLPLLGTLSALTSPFLQCNKGLIFTP